jgi:hypothetical protein
LVAGGLGSCFSAIVTVPGDVIAQRLMVQNEAGAKYHYKSGWGKLNFSKINIPKRWI